jgi:hypothetical protein
MAPMVASMIAPIIPKPTWIPRRGNIQIADKSVDNPDRHVTNYAKSGPLNNLTG